ncbi:hypothetical protein HGM15179_003121 [Zosterops borbonicus]|uniref:Uncharacterized protein n=1 Tax=Zosterops borbonicus TaxID=364589 RepID=A0A8K1GUJ0_9PASS|nr:hypothetical protein HGM15179_003121 [Zosterops borbonicus]
MSGSCVLQSMPAAYGEEEPAQSCGGPLGLGLLLPLTHRSMPAAYGEEEPAQSCGGPLGLGLLLPLTHRVVTVLQQTWEFVEIEQHLLFFITWELESLGPKKDLVVHVPNQTYCL